MMNRRTRITVVMTIGGVVVMMITTRRLLNGDFVRCLYNAMVGSQLSSALGLR